MNIKYLNYRTSLNLSEPTMFTIKNVYGRLLIQAIGYQDKGIDISHLKKEFILLKLKY